MELDTVIQGDALEDVFYCVECRAPRALGAGLWCDDCVERDRAGGAVIYPPMRLTLIEGPCAGGQMRLNLETDHA